MTTIEGQRKSKQNKDTPVDAAKPAGLIRLVRTGGELIVSRRDGVDGPLITLGSFEIGPAPVKNFRLGVNPERNKNPVDVRLLELTLKTDNKPGEAPPGAPPTGSRRFLLFGLALAVILVLATAIAFGFAVARRRRTTERQDESVTPDR
jgi:hypothetical protein